MEFRYDEIDNDVLIISADGGLNADTAADFVQSIEKLVDAGLCKIIIDCKDLTYVSSYGLGVLIRLNKRVRNRGGDVKLASITGIVPQALQATRLDRLFAIYADVNRARLAFRPAARKES
jgi:anti-anti-sigma factor